MTADEALAQLAAARLRLFAASQAREAVVMRRVRVDGQDEYDALNDEIAAARGAVLDATAAVQATTIEAP